MNRASAAAIERERRRLSEVLHGSVVQQVTALSLAVDSALLHHADGDLAAVGDALRTIRRISDTTIADCRTMIDELRGHWDP